MTKHCLICERAIEVDDVAVHDATVWRTHGDYGSKVYDPLCGDVFLETFICDECLLKKKALIEEVASRVDGAMQQSPRQRDILGQDSRGKLTTPLD